MTDIRIKIKYLAFFAMRNEFIFVKNSLLYFYKKVPLYYFADNDECVLYKPAGITLKEMRIKEKLLPKKLYIKPQSKIDAIKEVQKGYNKELKNSIKHNDLNSIRSILHNIVEVTFEEPIIGSLEGIRNTVNILVNEYTEDFNVLIRSDFFIVYSCGDRESIQ